MSQVSVDLDEDLARLLPPIHQNVNDTVRELLVLELYRRGAISSGKGADLLAITRQAFIEHASSLGIAYLDMSPDEWANERNQGIKL